MKPHLVSSWHKLETTFEVSQTSRFRNWTFIFYSLTDDPGEGNLWSVHKSKKQFETLLFWVRACFLGGLCSRAPFLAKSSFLHCSYVQTPCYVVHQFREASQDKFLLFRKLSVECWLDKVFNVPVWFPKVLHVCSVVFLLRPLKDDITACCCMKYKYSCIAFDFLGVRVLAISWPAMIRQMDPIPESSYASILQRYHGSGTRYWPIHRCHLSSTSLLISLSHQPHWHVTLTICVSTIQLRAMGKVKVAISFHHPWSAEDEIQLWYEELVITPGIVHDQMRLRRKQLRCFSR